MKNIEKLESIDYDLCYFIRVVESMLNKRYYICDSKMCINEIDYYNSFVQFDFKYDFHFMINLHEFEEVINSKVSYEKYISELSSKIEQDFIKETIKR